MKEAGLTKQERSFLALIRIWMVLFFLGMLVFIIVPDWSLYYLANIGRVIFGLSEPPFTLGAERFWLVLAVAYMAVITYICFEVQIDLLRKIEYARTVIIAKLVTTTGFIFCLVWHGYRFFYLTGAVVDGFILLITWYYYIAAVKSRAR